MTAKLLWTTFRRFDIFMDRHIGILLLLLLTLVLRIPSFAEPYWYGDEAIYLTTGNSLRAGERMYVDIIDHKTPLIYYFAAAAGNQLNFRIMTTAFVIVSVLAFYMMTERFFAQRWLRYLSTLLFVFLINLPMFEGNIPNGELFMMTFVLLGIVLFQRTPLYEFFSYLDEEKRLAHIGDETKKLFVIPHKSYLTIGALLGIATLIKVPTLLELGMIFASGWFVMAEIIFNKKITEKDRLIHAIVRKERILQKIVWALIYVGLGWLAMIVLSIVYFALRGSFSAYLDYGLLYNFRYAGSFIPTLTVPALSFLLDLKVKIALLVLGVLALTAARRHLSTTVLFAGTWLLLTLVATTLSNRPYPHYFLQLFPSVALLIGVVLGSISAVIFAQKSGKFFAFTNAVAAVLFLTSVIGTFGLLDLGYYPTVSYYQKYLKAVTGRITWDEYRNSFNSHIEDNYAVLPILAAHPEQEIFIWGNNPLLYALSKKNPVGRFIVSFHIADFNAYNETMDAVRQKAPSYIVVMNEEKSLDGLDAFLSSDYLQFGNYSSFTLWKKKSIE